MTAAGRVIRLATAAVLVAFAIYAANRVTKNELAEAAVFIWWGSFVSFSLCALAGQPGLGLVAFTGTKLAGVVMLVGHVLWWWDGRLWSDWHPVPRAALAAGGAIAHTMLALAVFHFVGMSAAGIAAGKKIHQK